MPKQKPKDVNARRFAAVMAGCDTGNPSEEEAVSKFRALRRMATDAGLRIVDVLEIPDVRQALDDQMRPVRQDSRELHEVMEQAATLRRELTERTRDVRKLAELLAKKQSGQTGPKVVARRSGESSRGVGVQVVADLVALVVVLALMCMSSSIKGCRPRPWRC